MLAHIRKTCQSLESITIFTCKEKYRGGGTERAALFCPIGIQPGVLDSGEWWTTDNWVTDRVYCWVRSNSIHDVIKGTGGVRYRGETMAEALVTIEGCCYAL